MREVEMYLESAPDDPGPYRRLDLNWQNGYVPQELNLGFPEIRGNTGKKPDANGEIDYTKHFGASAVQIKLSFANEGMATPVSDRRLEDGLRRWLNPLRRTHLVYRQRGEEDWRFIYLRSNGGARTLQLATTRFGEITMTFRAPRGVSQAPLEPNMVPLSFGGAESGRTYDLTFDRTYPASGIIGVNEIVNNGTADSLPTAWFYGPATDFRLDNLTTGLTLKFKSTFALLAGEFLVVNFEDGTVLMGNDANNPRYNQLDTTQNEWWTLIEGTNLIRPVAATFTGPQAHVDLYWFDNYI